MNITAKRLLVMFSIALNLGFIVMAVIVVWQHPPFFKKDHLKENREILSRLDLPPDTEKNVNASMEEFRATHDNFVEKLHESRNETLKILAAPGPLDLLAFETQQKKVMEFMLRHHHYVGEHLMDIRCRLGNEKGAEFFSEILKQAEKRSLKK